MTRSTGSKSDFERKKGPVAEARHKHSLTVSPHRHRDGSHGASRDPLEHSEEALMFTTTAVVFTVGIAKWLERRTVRERPLHTRQHVKLLALLGAMLIILGVTADRIA